MRAPTRIEGNLYTVIDIMKSQKMPTELINSLLLAQKSLLAIEMMGIATHKQLNSPIPKHTST